MPTTVLGLQNTWAEADTIPETFLEAVADDLEYAFASRLALSVAGSSDVTLTTAQGSNRVLQLSGTLTGNISVIVPTWAGKEWLVINATAGAFTVTVKTAAGAGIIVTQGARAVLFCDASDIVRGTPDFTTAGAQFVPVDSPAQITSNQNDYAISTTAHVLRLSTDASRNITGLVAPAGPRRVVIINVGAQNLVLVNQSASSVAANRVITGTGSDATLSADDVAELIYDSLTLRWRMLYKT
jgi:hypothetical protein